MPANEELERRNRRSNASVPSCSVSLYLLAPATDHRSGPESEVPVDRSLAVSLFDRDRIIKVRIHRYVKERSPPRQPRNDHEKPQHTADAPHLVIRAPWSKIIRGWNSLCKHKRPCLVIQKVSVSCQASRRPISQARYQVQGHDRRTHSHCVGDMSNKDRSDSGSRSPARGVQPSFDHGSTRLVTRMPARQHLRRLSIISRLGRDVRCRHMLPHQTGPQPERVVCLVRV